jgi:hypothetical protein
MPKLLHYDGLQQKINKRIVKHMIKQATEQLPDVPPLAISEDVTQNYIALMKSLSFIILILNELQARNLALVDEGEADYPYEEGEEEEFGLPGYAMSESELSGVRSMPSRASSAVSMPFRRPGAVSPPSSLYSQPLSSRSSARYMLPPGEAPSRDEERLARNERNQNNPFSSLVLNSLSKEIINAKFLTEVIPFSQLTKIQKQKLKQIIVRINKVIGVIRTGVAKPIYINLITLINTITAGFKSTEGDYQEYLPRTEEEMPPEQAGEFEALVGHGHICGSTTSVYGAGRKHRLLSPAMYAAHNVNDLFQQSLSKRNR